MSRTRFAAFFFALFSCVLAVQAGGPQPILPKEPKLKVLVVTGGHGFEKDAFFEVFNSIPDITWREAVYGGKKLDAARVFAGGKWKEYDVFVFYDMIQNLSKEARAGIQALTEAGKGIVMLHHTLAAHQGWPFYRKLLGGKFYIREKVEAGVRHPKSTYRHGVEFSVHIVNPDHPVTYGMKDFKIHDETYNKYEVLPEVTPLLETKEPTSMRIVGWTHTCGNSRVVYIQHGHDHYAYQNPAFRRLVARAIRYTACRPAVPDRPFRAIFNGHDLKGWRALGTAEWRVRDGVLIGEQGPGNSPGDLITEEQFDDFEAVVVFRVKWPANSGVWFRYQGPGKAYQADILEWENPKCWTGTLYCPGKMFLSMNTDPKLVNKEGWNTFVIRAAGKHLIIFLNGKKTGDVFDDSSSKGAFGIQVHPGAQFGPMRIEIARFEVRPL